MRWPTAAYYKHGSDPDVIADLRARVAMSNVPVTKCPPGIARGLYYILTQTAGPTTRGGWRDGPALYEEME